MSNYANIDHRFLIISTKQSTLLKGLTILLMIFHHLFAYPSRIDASIEWFSIFSQPEVERVIGLISRVCVPMFLFLSGYGLTKSSGRTIQRVINFMGVFWFYLLSFVPIGYIWFSDVKTFDGMQLRYVYSFSFF